VGAPTARGHGRSRRRHTAARITELPCLARRPRYGVHAEGPDVETIECQITQMTENPPFQQWTGHRSGPLAELPKREVYRALLRRTGLRSTCLSGPFPMAVGGDAICWSSHPRSTPGPSASGYPVSMRSRPAMSGSPARSRGFPRRFKVREELMPNSQNELMSFQTCDAPSYPSPQPLRRRRHTGQKCRCPPF
jgi:hypothetical protein